MSKLSELNPKEKEQVEEIKMIMKKIKELQDKGEDDEFKRKMPIKTKLPTKEGKKKEEEKKEEEEKEEEKTDEDIAIDILKSDDSKLTSKSSIRKLARPPIITFQWFYNTNIGRRKLPLFTRNLSTDKKIQDRLKTYKKNLEIGYLVKYINSDSENNNLYGTIIKKEEQSRQDNTNQRIFGLREMPKIYKYTIGFLPLNEYVKKFLPENKKYIKNFMKKYKKMKLEIKDVYQNDIKHADVVAVDIKPMRDGSNRTYNLDYLKEDIFLETMRLFHSNKFYPTFIKKNDRIIKPEQQIPYEVSKMKILLNEKTDKEYRDKLKSSSYGKNVVITINIKLNLNKLDKDGKKTRKVSDGINNLITKLCDKAKINLNNEIGNLKLSDKYFSSINEMSNKYKLDTLSNMKNELKNIETTSIELKKYFDIFDKYIKKYGVDDNKVRAIPDLLYVYDILDKRLKRYNEILSYKGGYKKRRGTRRKRNTKRTRKLRKKTKNHTRRNK